MLVILGAGSFAREVYDLCQDLGWDVSAFVVDQGETNKPSVIHVDELVGKGHFIPAIISPKRRNLIIKVVQRGWHARPLIHPSASVSSTVWRDGTVVNRGAVVGNGSYLLYGSIINRGATIGHDCTIGVCSTIGPGANLAGFVTVGHGVTVGMGANIREGIDIGHDAVIGMGSVVTKNVPSGETWWGVPARKR